MSASLVYPKEPTLGRIAWLFSAAVWTLLVVGTLGLSVPFLLMGFVGYLFVQSAFIARLKGAAVRVGPDQLPELHQQLTECCDRLGMATVPETYVMNADGMLNALACRFLRRYYVVLFSDIVDAFSDRPAALDFYLGHELGHIQRGHVRRMGFLAPARMLPLLGTAYARAREYTCDLHGLACCDDAKDAAFALVVLAAGERSWSQINLNRFAAQSQETGGFWMSYHELTGEYPWLTKRMKHLMSVAAGQQPSFPSRHPMAWLVAFFTPPVAGGNAGGMGSVMAMVAVIGIIAAIAIPNFLRFQLKSKVSAVAKARTQIEAATTGYIERTGYLPDTLADTGLSDPFVTGQIAGVSIGESGLAMTLTPDLAKGVGGDTVTLTPYLDEGAVRWRCDGNLDPTFLEQACTTRGSGEDGSSAEAAAGGGAASSTAEGRLQVGEATCSSSFRESARYAQLGPELQARLREACNAWKLEQFEAGL
jgi:Zn-dependent protease with chaperone function/Tfp pilus assembly major pilin PilA